MLFPIFFFGFLFFVWFIFFRYFFFVELNDFGEVIVNDYGETSEEGIFACGDVTTVPYKQIIISMGEGAKASLAASDYLMKLSA